LNELGLVPTPINSHKNCKAVPASAENGLVVSNRLRDDISFSHEAHTASDRLRDDFIFSHEAHTASDRLRDDISFSHEAHTE